MRLKALFGSDIGHMDAPDFTRVVEETYELVDDEVLTPDEYRMFVADHATLLHGRMNANFFRGTAIEAYAEKVLACDVDGRKPRPAETRPAGKPKPRPAETRPAGKSSRRSRANPPQLIVRWDLEES